MDCVLYVGLGTVFLRWGRRLKADAKVSAGADSAKKD